MRTKRKTRDSWQGCYDAGWKGLIADEAFAHPAKFARNLIGRIYRHMLARGWLAPGMTVVDPFGGVALGALDAMANGLHWTGVELESRFHVLGNANIAEWVRRYGHSAGWGSARLLNGDSRRLCEVVGGADCVVGSPPFQNSQETGVIDFDKIARPPGDRPGPRSQGHTNASYGQSPGQLGSMKAGSVDAVLSSPPFQGAHSGAVDETSLVPDRPGRAMVGGYGTAPGSLGNLRPGSVEAVVSSPPYEGNPQSKESLDGKNLATRTNPRRPGEKLYFTEYAKQSAEGSLGNSTGETFWHAAREIVQQCHAILRPGGIAAWVTKDFVRNKARVPFSADWLKLCEACGFELVEWVQASLVKDLGKHADLYGETHHRTVERKSFFRRLAEKKGSPRIDHEDVLFVRKR